MNQETEDITAIIVNYRTPELTRMALWSLHSLYPDLKILLIDNNSPTAELTQIEKYLEHLKGVQLIKNKTNRHHGPAMDQALQMCRSRFALLFDSDCIAYRKGFIEAMKKAHGEDSYMTGEMQYLNHRGFNVSENEPERLPYIHPHCALINVEQYAGLPPFEKHGSPCFSNQKEANRRKLKLTDFPVDEYVYHIGRGTVNEIGGYKLGLPGYLNKIGNRLSKLLP